MQRSTKADRAGGDNPSPALSAAQELSPAEESARLAADAQIVDILRAEGFTGPRWGVVEERLMHYGWSVLMKWVQDGQIFEECSKINRGLRADETVRSILRDNREARSDLVTDTVIAASDSFRESLMIGRWEPGTSSLTTYFTGACIRSFPNSYRRWSKSLENRDLLLFDDAELVTVLDRDFALGDPDPAAAVIAKESEQSIIATLPTNLRKIAELRALGYMNTEIAKILNLSVDTVETRLARERKRRKRRR
ncbi:hypothetical protein GFH48_12665 [Streptomyces fagopyri]|uniref:RNA polymerase sigma factor 70 region 4 type 2 domain-containing protein n=1 Tax=Streptomyces fagopyri TaxID=2662397 RepID=A0A5Q0LAW8_9ACTN|nr:sigma factor-like helix-turn-helix DNA-binding protein [Streptomyces fagopyri]QFZ73984.1 hypothetical protein GFH48_12665 [Streptomyces fagopyri]